MTKQPKKLYYQVGNKNPRSKDTFLVEVELCNTRQIFGRTERLITPVKGYGYIWVDERTLKLN